MERKDFLLKGLLGTGIFAANAALGRIASNEIDELRPLEVIGFNHIPNTSSQIMASTILHKADSRGLADHGWLNSHHTFSFANYHNPERMHFGVLRVLNDDVVSGGMGFGKHPHDNMEIISIPLEGDLVHNDSMGNAQTISNGDIQIMSAGTGIEHSEKNNNHDKPVKFLQIWVFPKKRDITPRYDQITLNKEDRHNKLQQIVSPNNEDPGVMINQDAWFHLGTFDQGVKTEYAMKNPRNGLYAFVLKGEFTMAGQALSQRDGLGVWDIEKTTIEAVSPGAEILLMEVPMEL